MTSVPVNFALTLIPTALVVFFVSRRFTRSADDRSALWRSFFFGFLAIIPAALLLFAAVLILRPVGYAAFLTSTTDHSITGVLLRSFLIAGLLEESLKLGAVYLAAYHRHALSGLRDGILLTSAAALGFAFFENSFYLTSAVTLVTLRAVATVALHASASGLMGYTLALSKLDQGHVLPGLLVAALLHGSYNALLVAAPWTPVFAFLLVAAAVVAVTALYRTAGHKDIMAGRIP